MEGSGRKTSGTRRVFIFLLKAVILFAVYFATAKFGLALTAVGKFAAPVWPPTGIAIAFVFLWGDAYALVILVAAAAVNYTVGGSVPIALMLGIGNALEALTAVTLLRRFTFHPAFDRVRDVLVFVGSAGILGPLVSATVGVTTLQVAGLVTAGYLQTWLTWWIGDVLGAVIVAPFILVFATLGWFKLSRRQAAEGILLLFVTIAFEYVLFLRPPSTLLAPLYLLAMYPLFGWAAIRFKLRGTALIMLVTSAFAIAGAVIRPQPGGLLILQAFLGTIAIPHLLIAASTQERDDAKRKVEAMNKDLKKTVIRQTYTIEEEGRRDEATLEAIGEGIVAVDTHGRVVRFNAAARSMLGIESEAVVIGRQYFELFGLTDMNGRNVPRRSRPLVLCLETGERINASVEPKFLMVRNDATTFPAGIIVNPVVSGGKTIGAVQVFRDLTEEAAAERAKSEFVALASHQLRTPLTAVRWYADALAETKERAEREKMLAQIRRSVVRMAAIVSTILDVSKFEAGTVKSKAVRIDPRRMLDDVLQGLAVQMDERQLAVEREYPAKAVTVKADPVLLRVALENLVSNAVKYSRPGGTVVVSVRKTAGEVRIAVEDQGIGILKDEQKRVFTKFFRGSNAKKIETEGNGLGLYLTKSYIEQMGGKIWFESRPGEVTTFFVTMPT